MIEHLTELVIELNKQGYSWAFPIEVKPDYVRVIDGRFEEGAYYVSWNGTDFEVSLSIQKEDGSLIEVSPSKRQTIKQVVDYIME
jgi:hypothetical protein